MQIPETILYTDTLPETECLLLLPGAVKGGAEDPAAALLGPAVWALKPGAPVCELRVPGIPAAHLLAARAEPLDQTDPAGVETLRRCLTEAIELADGLGVKEMSFPAIPANTRDSRLFGIMTVVFRVLMQEREKHPCLGRIRFFCPEKADAEWICRVYNFYYPQDKSERMLP